MRKLLLALAISLTAGPAMNAQTPRLSLFEEFTGENCGPCAATNPKLNTLLANQSAKVVAIKWEVPIPSAPSKPWSLYQTNKNEINWRSSYSGNSYAPEGRLDGQKQTVFGAGSDHAGDLDSNVIANAAAVTSPFAITMLRQWNHSCSAVNLTITVQASANFAASGNLVFRTVMVEKLITFSVAPGTNGEKTFKDVAIKSFPSIQNGVALQKSWTNGQSFTFTLSCEVPSYARKKTEVAFVGFIQDDGNKKVIQAARTGTEPVPAEALSQVNAQTELLSCSGAVSPTVSFKNEGPAAISQATIIPYDGNVAGPGTVWTGNLASGASVVVALNSLPVSTVTGMHNFTYDVLLNVPNYNLIGGRQTSQFIVASAYEKVDVKEGFAGVFPPARWSSVNPNGGSGWGKTTATGGYNRSSDALMYGCFSNTVIGDMDEMYLPPVDLTSDGDPVLKFDMAYATRGGKNDQLQVMASKDCGSNWSIVFDKAGAELTTIEEEKTISYFPDIYDSTEWKTMTVNLPGFNAPEVLVKFVVNNDNGNNLFIDNVNLMKFDGVGLPENRMVSSLMLFPNPSTGNAIIRLNSQITSALQVTLVNAMGQVCYVNEHKLQAGKNEIQIDVDLAAGIYNLSLQNENESFSKKLIIVK